jgi:hypothetical protein
LKSKAINQNNLYKIDLDTTDQDGDFLCPCCVVKISPDDDSEQVYSIVDINVRFGSLDEVVICCKKCMSLIHLTGFSKIEDLK